MKEQAFDPAEVLRHIGQSGEGPHNIAHAALMLAALDHSGRSLEPYESHLNDISEKARRDLKGIVHAEDAARVLSAVMVGRFGYDGDRLSYDDPKNADLMAVIDRRRGLPVALGILYMHAARAAGIEIFGLSTPAHFLLRIEMSRRHVLVDPFNGGAAVEAEHLAGPPSTVSASPDDPRVARQVSDTSVLLRLQNNLKVRAIATGERARALEIAKRMVLIAPKVPELWIDLAHLSETAGSLGSAKRAYEACLALVNPGSPLHNEAAVGLHGLKRRLH